jgi:TonB family protein
MFSSGQLARRFAAVALLALSPLPGGAARATPNVPRQSDAEQLKTRLAGQLAEVEAQFAVLRDRSAGPMVGARLAAWQEELARRFGRAAGTVEEIVKLNPPDADSWRERLETLTLYAQPVSSPAGRNVFGAREVSKRARVTQAPAAEPTAEARAAGARGDVRLRLVLASDGTVRHVFPVKSLGHGLTEAAVDAARRIVFEPAVRDGRPVSQFATFVYEFKGDRPAEPYVPRTIF